MEWPQGPHPELTAALDLAGGAPALHQVLDHFSSVPDGWRRVPEGNAVTYLPKDNESVALATTPHYFLAGLASSVAQAIKRDGVTHENLGGAAPFKAVSASLPAPAGLFAYLNTAALVDHAYGLGRPVIAVALAFDPTSSAMVDASKLPSASVLVKHLGATGLSRSVTPEGQLLTARGPITLPQLLLGVTAAGAAAFPLIQQSLPAGTLPPLFLPRRDHAALRPTSRQNRSSPPRLRPRQIRPLLPPVSSESDTQSRRARSANCHRDRSKPRNCPNLNTFWLLRQNFSREKRNAC